jgi:hypothetical protein
MEASSRVFVDFDVNTSLGNVGQFLLALT